VNVPTARARRPSSVVSRHRRPEIGEPVERVLASAGRRRGARRRRRPAPSAAPRGGRARRIRAGDEARATRRSSASIRARASRSACDGVPRPIDPRADSRNGDAPPGARRPGARARGRNLGRMPGLARLRVAVRASGRSGCGRRLQGRSQNRADERAAIAERVDPMARWWPDVDPSGPLRAGGLDELRRHGRRKRVLDPSGRRPALERRAEHRSDGHTRGRDGWRSPIRGAAAARRSLDRERIVAGSARACRRPGGADDVSPSRSRARAAWRRTPRGRARQPRE